MSDTKINIKISELTQLNSPLYNYRIPLVNMDLLTTQYSEISKLLKAFNIFDVRDDAFGAKLDGSTDDSTAIQAAIDAAELVGGTVIIPTTPGSFAAIESTLVIDRPMSLYGFGAGSYENDGYFTPQSTIKWTGAAGGTMLQIGDKAEQVANIPIQGICLHGNNLAATCLDINALTQSIIRDILCYDYTGIGMKISSLTAGEAMNSMFNEFTNLNLYSTRSGSQGLVTYDDGTIARNNVCLNTFNNLKIVFNGNSPGLVLCGDNNLFNRTFTYRAGGTGYAIQITGGVAAPSVHGRGWGSNTFIGLTMGTVAGGGRINVINTSVGNIVIGYDRSNGEALPVIEVGSSLAGIIVWGVNYISALFGIHGISRGSEPVYEYSYSSQIDAGETTLAITFDVEFESDEYTVHITPYWDTTAFVSNRLTTGFTANFGTAAPGGGSAFHWSVAGTAY